MAVHFLPRAPSRFAVISLFLVCLPPLCTGLSDQVVIVSAFSAAMTDLSVEDPSLSPSTACDPLSANGSCASTLQSLLQLKQGHFRDAAEALTLAVHASFLDSGFTPLYGHTNVRGEFLTEGRDSSEAVDSPLEVSTSHGDYVRLADGRVAQVVYDPAAFHLDEKPSTSPEYTLSYSRRRGLEELTGKKKPEWRVQIRCAVAGFALTVSARDEATGDEFLAAEFPLEAAASILELDTQGRGGRPRDSTPGRGKEDDTENEGRSNLKQSTKGLLASIESRLISPLVRALAPCAKMNPTDRGGAAKPPPEGSTSSALSHASPELPTSSLSPPSSLPHAGGPSVGGQDLRAPGLPDSTRRPEEAFPPRPDQEEGGTHVGPRHPFFFGDEPGGRDRLPMPPLPEGFVPGARYDPIGPFGVEPNPDHERPPRWDNRGDLDPTGRSPFGSAFGNFPGGRFGGGGGGFGGGFI
ncbi:hypothetical protein BESB_047290 [Besnoitia besnoiti]|uniref:PI31 proteasome regulator C-terminal domain-containing protein n=1 Tax=Besnoitia besnoiti TaxID=94643 RepID=A0A2A9MLK6_BESBE|nr:hypothetical protein BESB_047290 [Besnoitia besnoiti]PFH36537.1 hypothetical protein BESB_047290 [Besnoitia besnoiti]